MPKIRDDEQCPCGSGKLFRDCHGRLVAQTRVPARITTHVPLAVIPEPDPNSAAVFEKTGEGTILFQGLESEISQDCGTCGAPLIVGLELGQVQGIVVKCSSCKSFNLVSH
jgi:hypothetical protein